ncbi:MAG TPA: type IV pilin N-terminal domain-containing protein [Methanoregula sp.]|nr:type IV pilin N-terminal domain-containing protein [Methanoregula sp.]
MTTRESAVSPVVGVMLMLAVTIMIAAIVSATAGSFTETQKTPSAILDVSIYSAKQYDGFSAPAITIRHISGNVLQTKDLRIVTYYSVPNGNTSKGSLLGETTVTLNDGRRCGALFITDQNRFGTTDTVLLSSAGTGGSASWFGNASAVFKPGDILVTPAQYCNNEDTDAKNTNLHRNPGMEKLFPNVKFIRGTSTDTDEFTPGGVVNVKIIHIPSGRMIFDKDVVIG